MECHLGKGRNSHRRATKIVKPIARLTYQQRLKVLGLPSLEYRRLRNDMVETYKILTGVDKADKHQLFELENQGRTRGHPLKIKKKHCRINVRMDCKWSPHGITYRKKLFFRQMCT